MLAYLSKKIAIPNQLKLQCISWNQEQGWIACGGEAGLLKVLKLETTSGPDARIMGVAAPTNLSMNQTLEGHNGTVMCLAWNPTYKKLTTSDEKGLIIVWVLHKGMWYEEMINNRNKSVVMDMKWTSDGKKICIIYEDGAVIVGSVDGNRLWGKELNLPLRRVEWSPDSRFIIFITQDSEAFMFDSEGSKIKTMTLAALQSMESSVSEEVSIVGIDWYCSSLRFTRSTMSDGGQYLCIAFDNGIAQISRGDDDNDPIVFDTELLIKSCKWSPDGAVIAFIGGQVKSSSTSAPFSSKKSSKESEPRSTNYIKFYSANGHFLRQVRIPGDEINSITWESSGLRIGLAVDAFIFFANVRMTYLWSYLQNTVIYSYYRPERKESVVIFWDLTSGETYLKYVPQLEFLVASGDHCALVICDAPQGTTTGAGAVTTAAGAAAGSGGGGRRSQRYTGGQSDEYSVQLRNSVGAIVHTRRLPFQPKYVSMGTNHLTVANDRTVYVWQFQTASSSSSLTPSSAAAAASGGGGDSYVSGRNSQSKERIFDIETIAYSQVQPLETFKISTEAVMNPISCLTISDKYLMIGRKSGSITRFTLPHLSAENEYFTNGGMEPFRIELSCHSSKLGIIDASGVFSIIDLDARPSPPETNFDPEGSMDGAAGGEGEGKTSGEGGRGGENKGAGQRLKVERRDVWDMKWADDNDEMICVMEKTKLQVFRGEIAEEPITASGFLCRFQNLEVRSVILDEILKQPIEQQPQPPSRDLVIDFESKSLREVREKMTSEGLAAGYAAAERSPHPRLFRLIAETALEALDLMTAEKSFVKCEDYHAIQLVRQLREMEATDKMKARAEVAVYLKKYDDAEALYREIDRKDLAISMRKRICDYPRVVQLLQTGGGNDVLMREAWDKIAEQYADRFKFKKALQYFKQSRNMERVIDCLYRLEMFSELAEMRGEVPDGTPLLHSLAIKFANLGMHEEAVDCYLRGGNAKAAIDCCVIQNRWDLALQLAEEHDFPQVEGLLTRYAQNLLMKGKKLEAVELYRRANRPTDSAILIGDIAEQAARKDVHPYLAKRLHVLAALEIERHRKKTLDQAANNATKAGGTLDGTTANNQNIAMATAATLESLMMTSLDTQDGVTQATMTTTQGARKASRAFGNAWRGAAAYHYYMLAQRLFYGGNYDNAMKCSIKLCEYDDILNPRDIYSLLALTAYFNKFYGICSQAFVKLETIPSIPETERDKIETLAVKIFVKHSPVDPSILPDPYLKCLSMGKPYKACVITGRAILESPSYACKTCRHHMLDHDRGMHLHCVLCHSPIPYGSSSSGPGASYS